MNANIGAAAGTPNNKAWDQINSVPMNSEVDEYELDCDHLPARCRSMSEGYDILLPAITVTNTPL